MPGIQTQEIACYKILRRASLIFLEYRCGADKILSSPVILI